jgi:hypothetical protein
MIYGERGGTRSRLWRFLARPLAEGYSDVWEDGGGGGVRD